MGIGSIVAGENCTPFETLREAEVFDRGRSSSSVMSIRKRLPRHLVPRQLHHGAARQRRDVFARAVSRTKKKREKNNNSCNRVRATFELILPEEFKFCPTQGAPSPLFSLNATSRTNTENLKTSAVDASHLTTHSSNEFNFETVTLARGQNERAEPRVFSSTSADLPHR